MRIDRRSFISWLVALTAGAGVACSSGPGPGTASGSNRNLLTQQELAATNSQMVYQALERLRPSWLNSRGPANMGNMRDTEQAVANVYISGNRMGNVEYLKQVNVSDVHEIRFWGPGEAGARFGMGNPRGVIEIIPRR